MPFGARRIVSQRLIVAVVVSALGLAPSACSEDGGDTPGGSGGSGNAPASGGAAGSSGTSGRAGSSGASNGGEGADGGLGGTRGDAGAPGEGGVGADSGDGGNGADAGTGGAGAGGTSGGAGNGGAGGTGGGAGSGGNGGTGGMDPTGSGWRWAVQAGQAFGGDGMVTSVATLSNGTAYVAGYFHGSATFGNVVLASAGADDVFLAKYDPNGSVLWAVRAGGAGADQAASVSALADGTVFVTGTYVQNAAFGTTTLLSSGERRIFLAKYASSGSLTWAVRAGETGGEVATSVAALADGTTHVTGHFFGTTRFGTTTLVGSAANGDPSAFIARFRADGTPAWAAAVGGNTTGKAVASLTDGTTYVTGRFAGTASWGNTMLTSVASGDIFLAKYDPNGAFAWARRAGGAGDDYGTSVSTLADGNVYVAGVLRGGMYLARYDAAGSAVWSVERDISLGNHPPLSVSAHTDGSATVVGTHQGQTTFGTTMLRSYDSSIDGYVVKYSADGSPVWARNFGGRNEDEIRAASMLPNGTVFIGGRFVGSMSFGSTSISAQAWDLFLAAYDTNGSPVSALACGLITNSHTHAGGVSTLADGTSYVAGHFSGAADFGSTRFRSLGSLDTFLAKFDPDGRPLWAVRGGGNDWDQGLAVANLPDGTAYLAGVFSQSATIAGTSFDARGRDAFLAKYDSSGNAHWAVRAGGNGDDHARAVAVRADGSAIIAGTVVSTITIGNLTVPARTTGPDFFLAKYDADGGLVWVTREAVSSAVDAPFSLATLSDGTTYAAGSFVGSASFGNITFPAPTGGQAMFLAKYDADGHATSAITATGTASVVASSVSALPNGGAYVTGYFYGTADFGGTSLTSPAGDAGEDWFVAKYEPNGALAWVEQAGSTYSRGERVVALPDGGAYVAGTYRVTCCLNPPTVFGGSITLEPVGTGQEVVLARYSSTGALLWAISAGGPSDHYVTGLALPSDGSALVTGHYPGRATFGGTTLENDEVQGFLAKAVPPP